jgi:putative ABC transport system permease protein
VRTLRMGDRDAIAALPIVRRAAPGVETSVRIKSGSSATVTRLLGTTPDFPAVRGFRVQLGRFFGAADVQSARRVVVLGARVARALFDDDPVGRQIRVRGVPFDVIGVLAPKGVLADGDEDNQVLVPISAAQRRVLNVTSLSAVFVSVQGSGPRAMYDAESAIAALVRERHRSQRDGRPDFEIQNTARYFTMQTRTTETLDTLTTGLGLAATVLAGSGIMALMLLSVRERTSEIGLRMAVGATPGEIFAQFLGESASLALGGWLAGVLLGLGGAAVVGAIGKWPVTAPMTTMLASLGFSLTIGLLFGALPARRASMIEPILALRSA